MFILVMMGILFFPHLFFCHLGDFCFFVRYLLWMMHRGSSFVFVSWPFLSFCRALCDGWLPQSLACVSSTPGLKSAGKQLYVCAGVVGLRKRTWACAFPCVYTGVHTGKKARALRCVRYTTFSFRLHSLGVVGITAVRFPVSIHFVSVRCTSFRFVAFRYYFTYVRFGHGLHFSVSFFSFHFFS